MSSSEVTFWIGQLKAGEELAAQRLWEEYFTRLVGLARSKLRGAQKRVADEEDVALSAFDSFCRGAKLNRFPKLDDRHDLWQLLVMITARKAIDLRQHENRLRRGGGAVPVTAGSDDADLLHQVVGHEPSPEFAMLVAEASQALLQNLEDPDLKQIASWKMEGYTIEEVAEKLGVVTRTIERRLRLIRSLIWSQAD